MSNIHKPKSCETGKTGKEKSQDSKHTRLCFKGASKPLYKRNINYTCRDKGGERSRITDKGDSLEIDKSYYMHHEPHHYQWSPPSMPTDNYHIIHIHIHCLKYNHTYYFKQESRSDMVNIQGDNTTTRDQKWIFVNGLN